MASVHSAPPHHLQVWQQQVGENSSIRNSGEVRLQIPQGKTRNQRTQDIQKRTWVEDHQKCCEISIGTKHRCNPWLECSRIACPLLIVIGYIVLLATGIIKI